MGRGLPEPGFAPVAPWGPEAGGTLPPPPGTQPSRWSQDAGQGGLGPPLPLLVPPCLAPPHSLSEALQGRLRDPGPRALTPLGLSPPASSGVWCPRPWAHCRGPLVAAVTHFACSSGTGQRNLNLKQVLSSSPSFIALTPRSSHPRGGLPMDPQPLSRIRCVCTQRRVPVHTMHTVHYTCRHARTPREPH